MSDIFDREVSKTRLIQLRPVHPSQREVNAKEATTAGSETKAELQEKVKQADKKLEQAEKEAARILQNAREKIEQEQANWQKEQVKLKAEANKEGFDQGLKEGRENGYQEFQANISESRKVVETAKEDYKQIIASSEQAILDLSLRSAQKIMRNHLTEYPEDFLPLVKGVIAEVQDQPEITVAVHASMYQQILSQKEELESILSGRSTLTIYAQADLDIHSCKIESPFGSIDASVDSQLMELRKQLFELSRERELVE